MSLLLVTYGLARTGLEQSGLIDHIKFPLNLFDKTNWNTNSILNFSLCY